MCKNMQNNYRALLDEILWSDTIDFKCDDINDLVRLSAPSAFAHNWYCTNFEIDNVPFEMINRFIENMEISSVEDVHSYLEYLISDSCDSDYFDFINFFDSNKQPDIESENGRYAFSSCMNYSLQFRDIVKDRGFSAFEISEIVSFLRMAFTAGIIDLNEVQNICNPIISKVNSTYSTLQEFAESYICGGAYMLYKSTGFENGEFDKRPADKRFWDLTGIVKKITQNQDYWEK